MKKEAKANYQGFCDYSMGSICLELTEHARSQLNTTIDANYEWDGCYGEFPLRQDVCYVPLFASWSEWSALKRLSQRILQVYHLMLHESLKDGRPFGFCLIFSGGQGKNKAKVRSRHLKKIAKRLNKQLKSTVFVTVEQTF